MKLLAFGDSLTQGAELFEPHKPHNFTPEAVEWERANAWPRHLAERLGCEYENHALGGGSNASICRIAKEKVLSHLYNGTPASDLLVMLGTTNALRSEFPVVLKDGTTEHVRFLPSLPGNTWHLEAAADRGKLERIEKLRKIYVEDYSDPLINRPLQVMQVVETLCLLEKLGVRYFTFQALRWIPASQPNNPPMCKEELLAKRILGDRFFTDWEFSSFNVMQGHAQAKGGHPVLSGHIAWADYLHSLSHIYLPQLRNNA